MTYCVNPGCQSPQNPDTAGGFGLVVGVDRKGDPDTLQKNGADIVVQDLSELLLSDN